jgi:hypothetical protein
MYSAAGGTLRHGTRVGRCDRYNRQTMLMPILVALVEGDMLAEEANATTQTTT